MDHYETLGVARNATDEEIKAAFRRCASTAHPDRKGGSNERMAAVNKAYGVLGDPAKKARYDETGDDQEKPIERMAEELLMAVFCQALDADIEPVSHARERLASTRGQLESMRVAAKDEITRMQRRVGKTKVKEGAKNLVELILQDRIERKKREVAQQTEAIEANVIAVEMLKAYTGEKPAPAPVQTQHSQLEALMRAAQGAYQRGPFGY